jgi:hypothetical protein
LWDINYTVLGEREGNPASTSVCHAGSHHEIAEEIGKTREPIQHKSIGSPRFADEGARLYWKAERERRAETQKEKTNDNE